MHVDCMILEWLDDTEYYEVNSNVFNIIWLTHMRIRLYDY